MDQLHAGSPKRRTASSVNDIMARLEIYKENSPDFTITPEHEAAMLSIFRDHANVLVTGGAGTGKTTFIRDIVIPELDHKGLNFAVTATTGIAGSHLSGKTLHSWAGIGLGPYFPPQGTPPQERDPDNLRKIYEETYKEWSNGTKYGGSGMRDGVTKRIKGTEVLIIDEISMCAGAALLGYIDFFLKKLRDDERPFGGIQVIMIGDFFQLPPVEKGDPQIPDWAFLSDAWAGGKVKTIELTHVFRQADQVFAGFLNAIRKGEPVDPNYVRGFVRHLSAEESMCASYLVPTNAKADKLNNMVLDMYPGPTVCIDAKFEIEPSFLTNYETVEKVKGQLGKALRSKERLNLRIGVPVLFKVNDRSDRFVNGTKGFVTRFFDAAMKEVLAGEIEMVEVTIPKRGDREEQKILLQRTTTTRNQKEDPEEYDNVKDPETGKSESVRRWPTVLQFPLIPATAITIHACVDKSTLIPTVTGMREIEDICNSSEMPKVAGVTGYYESSYPFVGKTEPGYRITTKRGYSLLCSDRHPLLKVSDAGEEWVKSPLLRVGDTLRMRGATMAFGNGDLGAWDDRQDDGYNTKPYRIPTSMSDDLAWALGVLTGDGCLTDQRDGRIDVTSMDKEVLEKFTFVMHDLFGLSVTIAPKAGSKASNAYCHSLPVRRFFLHLGFSFDKGPLKRVPRAVFNGTQSHQAAFLRGYFDADGGVNTAVHVTSTSRELIGEVHVMLLNFGIMGTIAKVDAAPPRLANWRINITGVDVTKYRDLIGFTILRKTHKCIALAPDHRSIPKVSAGMYPANYGRLVAQAIREELRAVYPAPKGLGFGAKKCWAWFLSRAVSPSTLTSVTDAHFASMLCDLPLCADAGPCSRKVFGEASAGCFMDVITSIEREECSPRDICVPDGHAFVGNGFLNHNSQGMSLDECVVDLHQSFAPGHVYVAMSRLRTAAGLMLASEKFDVIVDKHVLKFYNGLRNEP